ncbi:hypothetical protein [Ralstonia wenshanensis]|uniref:DUF4407 domain-containing protein n=1 Tax=Ralstonia wenshanensis TaxID=2842456 RepID=A0AAD2ETQ4_9RALS|nr:hypothetical protein [Ralstonia wenshanensis]CAJ0701007.1 hypothetical protein LMG18091_03328 [Ralstonia wenshanensis]
MDKLAVDAPCGRTALNVSASAGTVSGSRLTWFQVIAVAIALLATAVSFGIAAYSSWLRGGTLVQQVMMVALAGAAVLYVHLIPMGWRAFTTGRVRTVGGALWCVGIVNLMAGQVTFFLQAQWDAGNQRAALAPAAEVSYAVGPHGRSLSEIAVSRVRVVTDLARINARGCAGDCPSVTAHKAKLSAQLAALDAEAVEAKRREAEEDRMVARVERAEALRESLRADPVASQIALWFGTTAQRLELVQAVAFAVVLEGAAIMGWLLAAAQWQRTRQRGAIALDDPKMVVQLLAGPVPAVEAVATVTEPVTTAERVAIESARWASTMSDDDADLEKIHAAVTAGELKRSLINIRKFLKCRQDRATRLNRVYIDRYGRGCV